MMLNLKVIYLTLHHASGRISACPIVPTPCVSGVLTTFGKT